MPTRSCQMAALALLAWLTPAHAETRIALVIGNGAYRAVTPLDNPAADAELIADTLRSVGFEVTVLTDSDQAAMKRGIADFGRSLRSAGPDATALFYYAGHAVQSEGVNWLLPVDSVISDAADLDLVGVEAAWVLHQLFSARNRTSIVILDACRNNPFGAQAGLTAHGLAEMKAPTGSFLAYATAPGDVALDGTGANSPFTEALAALIPVEGQPIEQVLKQVRVEVLEKTGGSQTPWDSSSLTADFFFKPAAAVSERDLAALQLWTSVNGTRDPIQIMLFLRAFPDSPFDAEARAMLSDAVAAELAAPQAPAVEAPAVDAVAEATAARESAAPEVVAAAPAAPETAAAPDGLPGGDVITYLAPLSRGEPHIVGRSIAEIVQGSPMYPPVEGLPESYWKDRTCGNCHAWTKQGLCDQGAFYVGDAGSRSLTKEHPLGPGFKQALRDWAAAGCQ